MENILPIELKILVYFARCNGPKRRFLQLENLKWKITCALLIEKNDGGVKKVERRKENSREEEKKKRNEIVKSEYNKEQ